MDSFPFIAAFFYVLKHFVVVSFEILPAQRPNLFYNTGRVLLFNHRNRKVGTKTTELNRKSNSQRPWNG
jgi:hypothetical protein